MRWFGESWGAPICNDTEQMDTPVGESCYECEVKIGEHSRGFEIPLFRKDKPPVNKYYHRYCLLKQIIPGAIDDDEVPLDKTMDYPPQSSS